MSHSSLCRSRNCRILDCVVLGCVVLDCVVLGIVVLDPVGVSKKTMELDQDMHMFRRIHADPGLKQLLKCRNRYSKIIPDFWLPELVNRVKYFYIFYSFVYNSECEFM